MKFRRKKKKQPKGFKISIDGFKIVQCPKCELVYSGEFRCPYCNTINPDVRDEVIEKGKKTCDNFQLRED